MSHSVGPVTVGGDDRAHKIIPLTVYASLGPNKDMRRRRGTALRHGALLTRSGSCARGGPSYPSRVHLAGGEGLRARVRLGPMRGLQQGVAGALPGGPLRGGRRGVGQGDEGPQQLPAIPGGLPRFRLDQPGQNQQARREIELMIAGLPGGGLLSREEPGGGRPSFLSAVGGFFSTDQGGELARLGPGAGVLGRELQQEALVLGRCAEAAHVGEAISEPWVVSHESSRSVCLVS